MDYSRALLAVVLSFLILVGYQYFLAPKIQPASAPATTTQQNSTANQDAGPNKDEAATPGAVSQVKAVPVDPAAKDITIDTSLYTAVISEQGGTIKGFSLKQYRETIQKDSGPMELVSTKQPATRPLLFSIDNGSSQNLPLFSPDKPEWSRKTSPNGAVELVMTSELSEGIRITQTMHFDDKSYLIPVQYKLENTTNRPVQVSPALTWNSVPFAHASLAGKYLFSGPAAYSNNELLTVKTKELEKGPVVQQGLISWAGYTDSYFITAVMPESKAPQTLSVQLLDKEKELTRNILSQGMSSLPANGSQTYAYTLYMGPKKLTVLQSVGHELSKAINYGWFDIIAKPMLWLLNFFYSFSKNYGIAIILLTILIKGAFWPITQKGMQSMKNMQKLQPKIAKLREKFKDDPAKMNQEMMGLYKTYKINPIGGCLPMIIQIPFFFALYKVLMAAIELRHAPFMLWINDLSAPDRLWVGFDIPYLHGLPVLTLLMGASMFLQQKMTPTTADPTQARVMQFLPIIFTFMFLNFASGLVLYWLVNNLLSILQQQLINRKSKA